MDDDKKHTNLLIVQELKLKFSSRNLSRSDSLSTLPVTSPEVSSAPHNRRTPSMFLDNKSFVSPRSRHSYAGPGLSTSWLKPSTKPLTTATPGSTSKKGSGGRPMSEDEESHNHPGTIKVDDEKPEKPLSVQELKLKFSTTNFYRSNTVSTLPRTSPKVSSAPHHMYTGTPYMFLDNTFVSPRSRHSFAGPGSSTTWLKPSTPPETTATPGSTSKKGSGGRPMSENEESHQHSGTTKDDDEKPEKPLSVQELKLKFSTTNFSRSNAVSTLPRPSPEVSSAPHHMYTGSMVLDNKPRSRISCAGLSIPPVTTATPDNATPDNVTPGNATPDNVTPGNVTPDNVTPGNATPDNVTPGNVTPDNVTPGNATPDNVTPGNVTPDNATPDNVTPDNVTPGNVTPDNITLGNSTPDNVTPDNIPPGNATPDNVTPGNATPDNATPDNVTPDNVTPGNATPDNVTTGNATPGNATPGNATPDNVTPDNATPYNVTPDNATPDNVTPDNVTPGNVTPGNATPDNVTPDNATPYNVTPDNATPDNVTPGNATPDNVTPDNVTPEDPDKVPEICLSNLWKHCKLEGRCRDMHYYLPYRWQIYKGTDWEDIPNMEEIEKCYCDPTIDSFQSIDFVTMRSGEHPVRRLSTVSSVMKPPEYVLTTEWLWYWKDAYGVWTLYGHSNDVINVNSTVSSSDLEEVYVADPTTVIPFIVFTHCYEMNFLEMKQTNVLFKTERDVRRRPKYLSFEDVKLLRGRTKSSAPQAPLKTAPPPLNTDIYPRTWDASALPDIGCKRILIPDTSSEFSEIVGSFTKTLSGHVVKKLWRLQNPSLWQVFQWQKQQMKKINQGQEVKEMRLFHGTEDKNIDTICNQNFDWRLCGTHATLYGQGSYFARDASYSHFYSSKAPDGTRSMFVARVLVGDYVDGDSKMKRPPLRPGSTTQYYDSCVDNITNPSIFVVFEKHQIYPEYLLEYEDDEPCVIC